MSKSGGYDVISAITFNDLSTVQALVSTDPTLTTFQDYSSRTALHHACLLDRAQITKFLLTVDKGALNQRDKSGQTPITLAKQRGNIGTLRVLAEAGCVSPLHKPPYPHARDLLLAAATAPASDVGKCIALFQAWVNWRNADGRCALHWATLRGDVDVVDTLLEAGANPDRPDRWGVTPRMEALRVGGDVGRVFENLF